MSVYALSDELIFPPVSEAEPDGLLAIGGDLKPERLLLAYRRGIFPWYDEDVSILWWSPDPRFVLYPEHFHVPASLRRVLRKDRFTVTFDRDFPAVIAHCGRVPRKDQEGTWITPDMIAAYTELHRLGHAHSVEVWQAGGLVGGLYGLTLGRAYFGESMFALAPDASKVALVKLVEQLTAAGVALIDCQVHTTHLERFGAEYIPRREYLRRLAAALGP